MDIDYTPLDIATVTKKSIHKSKSSILFVVIGVLTIIVIGLLVFILMKRSGV